MVDCDRFVGLGVCWVGCGRVGFARKKETHEHTHAHMRIYLYIFLSISMDLYLHGTHQSMVSQRRGW